MYKCEDCGAVFETPYEYREPDVNFFADWCPYCQSDAITEVHECKFCGELTAVYDLTIDGYCPECVAKTARKLNEFLSQREPEELQIFREEFQIEPINY